MKFKYAHIFLLFFMCIISHQVLAQKDYLAEIGVQGGNAFYLGDANNKVFNNNHYALGLMYRQKLSPRFALCGYYNYSAVEGSITNIEFSNPIHMGDVVAEFNFFDLEDKPYKPFSRKYAPFLFAGIGVGSYLEGTIPTFSLSYPFGIGLKIMLGNRINLNANWTTKIFTSDNIEGVSILNNPYLLNGTNLMNNDLISSINLGFTFDIFSKNCNCLRN